MSSSHIDTTRRRVGPKDCLKLIGERFNRLIVVGVTSKPNSSNINCTYFICRCDCGNETTVTASSVVRSHTQSCGCLISKRAKELSTTHGLSGSREYQCWADMWSRCSNSSNDSFNDYGGRGITVCAEWETFEQFYEDMGPRPGRGYSLDRIDNDKSYFPGNVRWSTSKEQASNRRSNRIVVIDGVSKTITEWSSEFGIHPITISDRLKRRWDPKKAVSVPVNKKFLRRATS